MYFKIKTELHPRLTAPIKMFIFYNNSRTVRRKEKKLNEEGK